MVHEVGLSENEPWKILFRRCEDEYDRELKNLISNK